MAQKQSCGVTAMHCVWASVVWGFFGSGGLEARSRIPWRRRERTQVHPGRRGKVTITARPWGAGSAPHAGSRRLGGGPAVPTACNPLTPPRTGPAGGGHVAPGPPRPARAQPGPGPAPPARARPPRENRKRAVPARAARGPPKRPAGGGAAGRGGGGGGGRQAATQAEPRHWYQPSRLTPRRSVRAGPRGEERAFLRRHRHSPEETRS